MRTIVGCLDVPRHQGRGTSGGCVLCGEAILEAVRARASPRVAFEHFSAVLRGAIAEMYKPRPWWSRKSKAVNSEGCGPDFARTAREVSAIALFNERYAPERGFPSKSSYGTFRAEELGLTGFPPLQYYEIQAALAGYPVPYVLLPDRATIAQLELHRESLTVPAEVQHVIRNHTGVYDYNGRGRVVPADVERLGDWINCHGHLPKPVVTYRQESKAHSGYGEAAAAWAELLERAAPGDEITWAERPVSTSLDPGFTRIMGYGWGDDEEWATRSRDIYFRITATKGYYVGSSTAMDHNEHELILAPRQRYLVRAIQQHTTMDMLGRKYGGRQHRLYVVLDEIQDWPVSF